jgi:hypothetical protein
MMVSEKFERMLEKGKSNVENKNCGRILFSHFARAGGVISGIYSNIFYIFSWLNEELQQTTGL